MAKVTRIKFADPPEDRRFAVERKVDGRPLARGLSLMEANALDHQRLSVRQVVIDQPIGRFGRNFRQ